MAHPRDFRHHIFLPKVGELDPSFFKNFLFPMDIPQLPLLEKTMTGALYMYAYCVSEFLLSKFYIKSNLVGCSIISL